MQGLGRNGVAVTFCHINISFFIKVLVSYHKLLHLFFLNNTSKFLEKEKEQKKFMVLW